VDRGVLGVVPEGGVDHGEEDRGEGDRVRGHEVRVVHGVHVLVQMGAHGLVPYDEDNMVEE
jgi:hypothetical protein